MVNFIARRVLSDVTSPAVVLVAELGLSWAIRQELEAHCLKKKTTGRMAGEWHTEGAQGQTLGQRMDESSRS